MPRTVLRLLPALLLIAAARPAVAEEVRHPVAKPGAKAAPRPGEPAGFWLGAGGVAAALAAFGAVSLAARRGKGFSDSKALRIVGRASLSPRHAIHLVHVGDRTLIVGTGPQGAPALLGEIEDAVEPAAASPALRPDPPAAHQPRGLGSAPPRVLDAGRRGRGATS